VKLILILQVNIDGSFTTTYYFTKWIESIPTRNANTNVVIEFLEENILARFGCPRKIITDNAPAFK